VNRHPANIQRHDLRSLGERVADAVATCMGSWRFIIIQTAALTGWVTLNALAWIHHWDPYPYIALNLALSCQAAYAAPILQLSQNRQAEHDRMRAEHDYDVNERTLALLQRIAEHLGLEDPTHGP